MGKKMITASIVIYNSPKKELQAVVTCTTNSSINTVYIIDNAENDNLKEFVQNLSEKVVYIQGYGNVGYGAAHNIAIRKSIEIGAKSHIILNPDIEFTEGTIEKLTAFMDEQPGVGLVMPKVLYSNGNIQYLCKLLPTPVDLFFRRFLFFVPRKQERTRRYELHNLDHSKVHFDIPSLSGCFMMFRVDVLRQIGGFDERFFMYMEDIDLCRRVHSISQTVFFPSATIVHHYEKGSYKNFRLLWYHIISAVRYFNKWGWFFDKRRKEINKKYLKKSFI
jgi:GT2 family glycosyltransferase